MDNILCYVEDIERTKFYIRFTNINIIFITTNITVYLYLKLHNYNVYIPKIIKNVSSYPNWDLNNTIEVKMNYVDRKNSLKLFWSLLNCIDKLYQKYKFTYIFIWNGNKIGDVACSYYADKNKVYKLYFEIANIPGKLFVDTSGTNRKSSIFLNPEQLDCIDKNIFSEYEVWKREYLEIKRKKFVLPQSKQKNKVKTAVSSLLNITAILFGVSIKNKVYELNFKNIIFYRKKNIEKYLEKFNLNEKKYLFVPLQVSNDTQIVLNSSIDLKQLIDKALEYSKKCNFRVVIKPHPAEKNHEILSYIKEKRNTNDIVITDYNTMKLIDNSEAVMTINSTVGLEAMIAGKKTIILGDAIYSHFNKNRLINYIIKFLIDVEYFSNEQINIDKIIRRI